MPARGTRCLQPHKSPIKIWIYFLVVVAEEMAVSFDYKRYCVLWICPHGSERLIDSWPVLFVGIYKSSLWKKFGNTVVTTETHSSDCPINKVFYREQTLLTSEWRDTCTKILPTHWWQCRGIGHTNISLLLALPDGECSLALLA